MHALAGVGEQASTSCRPSASCAARTAISRCARRPTRRTGGATCWCSTRRPPPVTASGGRRCSPRSSPTTRASTHRTFAWDRTDDARGAVDSEFGARGYEHRPERRHDRDARTRSIPTRGPTPRCEVKAARPRRRAAPTSAAGSRCSSSRSAARDTERSATEEAHRVFSRARQAELRAIVPGRRGSLVRGPRRRPRGRLDGHRRHRRGASRRRYQAVDTALTHRRRGICSRLLVDAARHAVATYGATDLVIVADPDYHAAGIYESVGFRPSSGCAACAAHPRPAAATPRTSSSGPAPARHGRRSRTGPTGRPRRRRWRRRTAPPRR